MNARRSLIAASTLVLACCTPPPEPAPPPPAPVATPAPTPAPVPALAARPDNWMDAAQTPGDWSYRQTSSSSVAQFGQAAQVPVALIGCDKARGSIYLMRPASDTPTERPARILTETATRVLSAAPSADAPNSLVISLPARDPILDAMAFSKGRFAVETGGMDTLYLPSWTEVTRVIEDCR